MSVRDSSIANLKSSAHEFLMSTRAPKFYSLLL